MTDLLVLIPILGRAEQVPTVLASIEAATSTDYRVLFIASPGDTDVHAAVRASTADLTIAPWKPDKADFARKINHVFPLTTEKWLFQAATDLNFHKGWDKEVLRVHSRGFGVVGTNDLGNPLVKRGQHSTHTFFTRDYIDKYGGTADNTGAVFSVVYDHQYCDNEFIQTAMLRHQFGFAHRAVVEHLHPHWSKSEMDETYEKATRKTAVDRALYQRRMRLIRNRVVRTGYARRRMR